MRWLTKVIVVVTLQYVSPSGGLPHPISSERLADNFIESGTLNDNILDVRTLPMTDDDRYTVIENYLRELLLLPDNQGLPLLYIEDGPAEEDYGEEEMPVVAQKFEDSPQKRSRYYRRYPWKRQNTRKARYNARVHRPSYTAALTSSEEYSDLTPRYDVDNRYICQPGKEDIFRLLVALHDSHQGGPRGRAVNFCNRKRPAATIFTNVRFIG